MLGVIDVGFEFLTSVLLKIRIFLDVTPCRLVNNYNSNIPEGLNIHDVLIFALQSFLVSFILKTEQHLGISEGFCSLYSWKLLYVAQLIVRFVQSDTKKREI